MEDPYKSHNPIIEQFLREKLGTLYSWKPTIVENPIGPQSPNAFDEFSRKQSAYLMMCRDYLIGEGSDLTSSNHLSRHAAELLWTQKHAPIVKMLIEEIPPTYAGGFGAIADKDAYKNWGAMEFWTASEAFSLSLGMTPSHINENKPINTKYTQQAEFALNRSEIIRRKWGEDVQITPTEFCKWAKETNLECPYLMFEAVKHFKKVSFESKNTSRKNDDGHLDPRAARTLYKIILGLARKYYKYDEEALRSEVPASIERHLKLQGVEVSAQTIKNHLKAAVDAEQNE